MIALNNNCTKTNHPAAIVSFNEMIGDIFLGLHALRRIRKKTILEILDELEVPIVILAFVDQNWGFLSTS